MSLNRHSSHPADQATDSQNGLPVSAQDQLAHELANLLDGSLRNLSLILSSLHNTEQSVLPATDHEPDILARLQSVDHGLKQMAQLIHRWMEQRKKVGTLYQDSRTLGQMIDHAVRLMYPAAKTRSIELLAQVDESASQLPAGPVYPIIANALRNSIESIASSSPPPGGGRVELTAIVQQGWVILSIRDNGAGVDASLLNSQGNFQFGRTTKPQGHGLGLSLCRQIALTLNGRLHLDNLPTRGARFLLEYPLSALDESARAHSLAKRQNH